ncbi:MAG: cyclic nucleotide-binding domain-containing protein [Proteobacteria bacterium]|nr:cyclic nucleotide-binding domain-containing protein [Pseudomonadota bacterium]
MAKELKDGDVIVAEGVVPERAYKIVQGNVELVKLVGGLQTPLGILDAGELVAADELLHARPMPATVQALGAVTLK